MGRDRGLERFFTEIDRGMIRVSIGHRIRWLKLLHDVSHRLGRWRHRHSHGVVQGLERDVGVLGIWTFGMRRPMLSANTSGKSARVSV